MGDYLYRGEGEKSIAFEIADELDADYIFVQIGNGTLLKGTWLGYVELEKAKVDGDSSERM
jgi:threonine synthase